MNHPGKWLSLLVFLIMGLSVWIIRANSFINQQSAGYVCPPCGCPAHDQVFDLPGRCPACGMPLIEKSHLNVSWIESIFRNEGHISFFHQRLLYPAYFLAIIIGFLMFWQMRHHIQGVLFLLFFICHIAFAFKNQLSGTSYSLHASLRWLYFSGSFLLVTSPALYLYVKYYQNRNQIFQNSDYWHFIPALIIFVMNGVFFFGPEEWRYFGRYNAYDHYPGLTEQILFIVGGFYYGVQSWKIVRKNSEKTTRKWLISLLIIQGIFLILWIFFMTMNALLYRLMSTSLDYHIIWVAIALFSIWGVYQMLFNRELVFPVRKEYRLSGEQMGNLRQKLTSYMEESKPYLDSGLTLTSLAKQVELKEKELSELINVGFSTNFYNYINRYRIDEVKEFLKDPNKQHLTNFGMAQEAGFSSKSTFFSLFKKWVGMTPGAFKNKHLNNSIGGSNTN